MIHKIWEWTSRTVYSISKNHVIKIAKINFDKLKYYLKSYKKIKEKNKDYTIIDVLKLSTWIIDNINEYKNSKITDKIAETKIAIFWLINIQKKYNSAEELYKNTYNNQEEFSKKIKELKEIIDYKKLIKKDKKAYSELMHFIDNLKNYWVNEKWDLILLDGWNNLIWEILRDKSEKIFNCLFEKHNLCKK